LIFGSFHQGKEQSQPAAIERADAGIVHTLYHMIPPSLYKVRQHRPIKWWR